MQTRRITIKYLTQEQTARFFSVIEDARDRALFATIYHYGLRVSEATLLRLEDVNFEQERITLTRLKNGRGGQRPLFSSTRDLLKAYMDVRLPVGSALFTGRQGNLKSSRMQQLFRGYARAADLGHSFSVHCLRHSIATHLLDAGQGIEYVRDHLGHVNIQSTMIYASVTDRRREEVFRQLEQSAEIVKVR